MQSVSSGEKSISLEYEITYYGDKDKRNGKYLYTYKNFTTKGVFEEATAEESLNLKPWDFGGEHGKQKGNIKKSYMATGFI